MSDYLPSLRAFVAQVGAEWSLWPKDDIFTHQLAAHRNQMIVQYLKDEDWSAIRKLFHPLLRFIFTEGLLRKGYDMITPTTGRLIHAGEPNTSISWVTTTRLTLEFKTARLGMEMMMTTSGQLISLRLGPQHLFGLVNAWQVPPYYQKDSFEEVEVTSRIAKLSVGGTLSLPSSDTACPCVIMLPGSGQVDRDSTVQAIKPFRDIAYGLASNGIASLRFDKVVARPGKPHTPSTEYIDGALDALRIALDNDRISNDHIFVLGHSLGGVFAPHLAAMEPSIAGCIVMAGPADPAYYHLAIRQMNYLASIASDACETDEERLARIPALQILQRQSELADSPNLSTSTWTYQLPLGLGAAYWLDMRRFDPVHVCEELCSRKPIMVMQGSRDYQVTMEHDFSKWQDALKDCRNVTLRTYNNLNHLFTYGEGPSLPSEYDTPSNVDERVIRDLGRWMWQMARKDC